MAEKRRIFLTYSRAASRPKKALNFLTICTAMRQFLFMAVSVVIAISHAEAREQPVSTGSSDLHSEAPQRHSAPTEPARATTYALTVRKIRIKQGDTLLQMLLDAGVRLSEANPAVSALAHKINLRKIRVGKALHLYLLPPTPQNQTFQLIGLILDQGRKQNWTLYRNYNYRFVAQRLSFQPAIDKIESAFAVTRPRPDGRFSRNVMLQRGGTLIGLLISVGADHRSATLASTEMAKQLNLRKLRAGQSVKITFEQTPDNKSNLRLLAVSLQTPTGEIATTSRHGNGTFAKMPSASKQRIPSTTERSADATTAPQQETSVAVASPETADVRGRPKNIPERQSKQEFAEKIISLGKGEILFNRIVSLGASRSDTQHAVEALGKRINLRRLHVGQKISVLFFVRNDGTHKLSGIRVPQRGLNTIEVSRTTDGLFADGPPDPELLTTEIPESATKTEADFSPKDNTKTLNASPPTKEAAVSEEIVRTIPTTRRMKLLNVNRGDTLSGLLKQAGSPNRDAKHALKSIREIYNPDLIRTGQKLVIELDIDGNRRRLIGMVLGVNKNIAIVVKLDGKQFRAHKAPGKALGDAISLSAKIEAARSALATGTYNSQTSAIYGFNAEKSDLVDLRDALRVKLALKPGDTLFETILDAGALRIDANAAIAAAKKIVNPRKLKAGQNISLAFVTSPNEQPSTVRLAELTIDLSAEQRLRVARLLDGEFVSGLVDRALHRENRRAVGTIENSLYNTAVAIGLPAEILIKLIRVFSYDVDFQRDIRKGDRFEALYETYTDETGETVRGSPLLYASMTLSGTKLAYYRFTLDDGFTDYFDEHGQSVRKALMRTPIDGARLTSSYGKRRHPTLGYSKMHRGVDFGAPRKTPIFAAGDGTVERASRNGAYGKYIRIRHGTKYQTAYAHLNAYATDIQRGERVKQGQVIGYVGSTGRSTGPHLHYEVLVNGKQVNPLAVKLPTGLFLKGTEFITFKTQRDQLRKAYDNVPTRQTLADKNDPN